MQILKEMNKKGVVYKWGKVIHEFMESNEPIKTLVFPKGLIGRAYTGFRCTIRDHKLPIYARRDQKSTLNVNKIHLTRTDMNGE